MASPVDDAGNPCSSDQLAAPVARFTRDVDRCFVCFTSCVQESICFRVDGDAEARAERIVVAAAQGCQLAIF